MHIHSINIIYYYFLSLLHGLFRDLKIRTVAAHDMTNPLR